MSGTTLFFWSLAGGQGGGELTQAVVPVLVGPMATLIPILAGAGVAILAYILRSLKSHWPKALAIVILEVAYYWLESRDLAIPWLATLGWFSEFAAITAIAAAAVIGIWTRRISLFIVAALVCGLCLGKFYWPQALPPTPPAGAVGREWSTFRGDPGRTGQVADSADPTTDEAVWMAKPNSPIKSDPFTTFYSSPGIVGDRVYIAAAEFGVYGEHGAIYSINADTGKTVWVYPSKQGDVQMRATYSSPSIAYSGKRDKDGKLDYTDGYVVCGEALHYCEDARVICLNLQGELLWQFKTHHHVEASPLIADGKAYIGAGEDGYYAFDLGPKKWIDQKNKIAEPAWHVGEVGATGPNFHDAESCPVVVDGVFYAGLGKNDGQSVIALDAATGKEVWRVRADYPVYCSPAIGQRIATGPDGQPHPETLMFISMGNADLLNPAEKVRTTDPGRMKDKHIAQDVIDRLTKEFKTDGEVWCFNLTAIKAAAASQPDSLAKVQPEWRLKVAGSVLGIASVGPEVTVSCEDIKGEFAIGEAVTQEGSKAIGSFVSLNKGANTVTLRWQSGTFDDSHPIKGASSLAVAQVAGAKTDPEGRLYFGSWDGFFYSYGTDKRLIARRDFHSPMPNNPAIGNDYIYVATQGGTLYCLDKDGLQPLWQTDLGQGVISSPAVARGHLYVGTMSDGLRCIGRNQAIPPVWNQGATGGLADRTPLPAGASLRATYPPVADAAFRVTAPVMPLSQLVKVTETVNAKPPAAGQPQGQPETRQVEKLLRFVYVPVRRPTSNPDAAAAAGSGGPAAQFALLKIRHGDLGRKVVGPRGGGRQLVDPIAWAQPFARMITVPPAAVADDIYVVEGGSAAAKGDAPTLHLLDPDGHRKWQADLLPGGSGQFTVDGKYIYIWSGPSTLACVWVKQATASEPAAGTILWSQACPGGNSVGLPTSGNGLVVAATAQNLNVLDAQTGQILWSQPVPGDPAITAGPLRLGKFILLATADGVYRIALAGGTVAWHAAIGPIAQSLVCDQEKLVAVTADGQLYVLDIADGQPWRVKPNPADREAKDVAARPHLLAPVGKVKDTMAKVDPTVIPVLSGDRIVFGGVKEVAAGEAPQTDLMMLNLPAKYQASPSPSPSTAVDGLSSEQGNSKNPAGLPVSVSVVPTRWCDGSVLGAILDPLVFVEGNVYTATTDLGLVYLAKQK